jgi:hypothetical protein
MWIKEAHQDLIPNTTGVLVASTALNSSVAASPKYSGKYAAYIRNTHASVSFYITATAAESESATQVEAGNCLLVAFDPAHPIYLYAGSAGTAKADVWHGEDSDSIGELVRMAVEKTGTERVYVDPATGDVTIYLDSALKNRLVYATATKDISFYLDDKCLGRLATSGGATDYPTFEISDGGSTYYLKLAVSGPVAHSANLTTLVTASVDASGYPTLTVKSKGGVFNLFEAAQTGAVAHTLQLGQHLTMSVASTGYPTLTLKDQADSLILFRVTQTAADAYTLTLAEHLTIARAAGGLLTFAQKDATNTDTILGVQETAAGAYLVTIAKDMVVIKAVTTGYITAVIHDGTGAIHMLEVNQTAAGVYDVILAEHVKAARTAGGLVDLTQKDATDTDIIFRAQETATNYIATLAKWLTVTTAIATKYPTMDLLDASGLVHLFRVMQTAAIAHAINITPCLTVQVDAVGLPTLTLTDQAAGIEIFKVTQTAAGVYTLTMSPRLTLAVANVNGYPNLDMTAVGGALHILGMEQTGAVAHDGHFTTRLAVSVDANGYPTFDLTDHTAAIHLLTIVQTGVGTYTARINGQDILTATSGTTIETALEATGALVEREYIAHVIHSVDCTTHAVSQAIVLAGFPTNAIVTRAIVELDEVFANAIAGVASCAVEIGDAGDPNGIMETASIFTGVALGWVSGALGAEGIKTTWETAYAPLLTLTVDGGHFVDDLSSAVNGTGELVVHIWYRKPTLHTP